MLLCFSSSHRTADFDLLERLERSAPAVTAALAEHSELVAGSVVVATCNRFEAYLDIDDPLPSARAVSSETVIDAVSAASGIPAEELREASAVYCDHSVAEHLFAVSSGLESVVVGEGEIAGQVRRSLESARAAGTVTSDLERLFQVASRTSRGVKNRTGIMTAGRSMVRLALDLAESRISDWAQTRVLLVGTGKYAGASLAALRDKGAEDVRVYSASGRAAKFALSHDVRPVVEGGLLEALARADLVVTCTTVTDYVLTRDLLAEAMEQPGAAERRLIVDLGLPRNVDPAVAELEGAELLDLETISIHAPLEELTAADDARSIVGAAAAEFAAQKAEQAVTPALVALRHLAGVLLHTPSVRARELARNGEADAFVAGAAALFGLELEPESVRPRLSAIDDQTA